MTTNNKINKIDIQDIEAFVKLCEAQRDLAYHLQKYKEAVAERVKELELITAKAQRVQQLKRKFRAIEPKIKMLLSPEEIKKINALLQQRHITI